MPEVGKNLQETLTEVVREQATANEATKESETKEELSQGTTGETVSGETPEYVSGIDISDIPVQDRAKLKPYLETKAKLLEKGYQDKFKEVATLKQAQEELRKSGLSVDEANDVLRKHIELKRNPNPVNQNKLVKTLDKLIEQSSYEQKPALEQMRQIILEETEVPTLKQKIEKMEQLLNELSGETTITKRSKVEQYVGGLSDEYGKELIDKYRDNFIDAHLRYKIPLEKLITSVIPLEELKQAILTKGRKPLTQEKKNAIQNKGSGVSSASEMIDHTNESYASLLGKIIKSK